MLKKDLEFLKEKREELRKKYNQDTTNQEVKKELLTVNRIIQRIIRSEILKNIKKTL